jgi:Rod binding domain-containing protein
MEDTKLLFPGQIAQVLPVGKLDKPKLDSASEAKKMQAAKDFESLLLNSLLSQMKDTIGNWGFEKDSASEQVDGIFWLYLARDMADKGGLGLWKNIYDSMPGNK